MNRFYEDFLAEKDYENHMFDTIMNCELNELAIYLTSPIEEERWLAQIRLKSLAQKK